MDNHYHLLVQTPDANLSKGMRQLNGVYTQAYNRRHGKTGHLFQGRYKAILVDADACLLELSRYIPLNPVKASMVKQVGDWRWSSYQAMVDRVTTPPWLSKDYLLAQFSKQRKTAIRKYQIFVEEGINRSSIWSQLTQQMYLGDKAFIDQAQKHLSTAHDDIQIPRVLRRAQPESLKFYEANTIDRNAAILAAYSSGGYSYQQIAEHFGVHFTTVGRIVRVEAQ
jgi:putative transposase